VPLADFVSILPEKYRAGAPIGEPAL